MPYHITKHRCYTIYTLLEVDDCTWLLGVKYNKLAPRPILFTHSDNRATVFDNKPVSDTLLVALAMHVYGTYSGIKGEDSEIVRSTMDELRAWLNEAVKKKTLEHQKMLEAHKMLMH